MVTDTAEDPVRYWWRVCRGVELMRAFHATPEHDAWGAIHAHPYLLLPELVDAAERTLGPSRAIAGLREMRESLRGSAHHAPFHRMLAIALAHEEAGSRRVNLERALAAIGEAASATVDPTDREANASAELAIRTALVALSPPPLNAMFLDDDDVDGLRRFEDRRDVNPRPDDRAYATNAGLAAGSATWLGDDATPLHRLVDTRWLFPSSKAATAYLHAPATLFRASDGLANPALLSLGDGAYAWGDTGRQCMLFRIDRVVAKLDATEGPKAAQVFQRLSRDHLEPYAAHAIRRARFALARYWLSVGRGSQAAHAFVNAPPRTARRVVAEFPILLLPEFPIAMASLGAPFREASERLAPLQGAVKSDWQHYRDLLRLLVRELLDDAGGDSRVNADAALRLVVAHRRLDSDRTWATLEEECSSRCYVVP